MVHEQVERGELALPDAVQAVLDVHAEVLVAPDGLQRYAEVAHLNNTGISVRVLIKVFFLPENLTSKLSIKNILTPCSVITYKI